MFAKNTVCHDFQSWQVWGTQAFSMNDADTAHVISDRLLYEIEQDRFRSLDAHVVQVDGI
jgi:hypothetical protein